MVATDVALLLLFVGIGSYLQAITGFALGLVVMGAAGALHLAPLPFLAVVISLVAFPNTAFALRGATQHIQWPIVGWTLLGLWPTVALGVHWLNLLSAENSALLRAVLAGLILVSALLLVLRPQPHKQASPRWLATLMGVFAGLFGGLFSTAGPPVIYHLYRQPWSVAEVRATLLAIFVFSTGFRISYVTLTGGMTAAMLWLGLLSLPIVWLCTSAARRWPPPLSDLNMRRLAFLLLALLGAMLLLI